MVLLNKLVLMFALCSSISGDEKKAEAMTCCSGDARGTVEQVGVDVCTLFKHFW